MTQLEEISTLAQIAITYLTGAFVGCLVAEVRYRGLSFARAIAYTFLAGVVSVTLRTILTQEVL